MTVIVYPDKDSLAKVTIARLCLAISDAGAQREHVHVAIAGGSVGSSLIAGLASSPLAAHVNWSQVHVWWVDERFVPATSPDRNHVAVDDALAALGLRAEHVHRMPSSDDADTPTQGAQAYAAELARFTQNGAPMPVFDVVVLGMGPDGHIASLFPHHPGLSVDSSGEPEQVSLGITDSPKPPSGRISLSLAAINRARHVWVAAWGAEKAPAIARAIAGDDREDTPAAAVSGLEQTLWLTDLAGAGDAAS